MVDLITSQGIFDLARQMLDPAPKYNTLYQGLLRSGVAKMSDGYPALWDKKQAVEYLQSLRDRKEQRATAPVRFAEAARALLVETHVPQTIPEVSARARLSPGRTTTTAIHGALEQGLIYARESRGSTYYLPSGASAQRDSSQDWPEIKASVGSLPARMREAYDTIVRVYCDRLVPLSATELGELMDTTDPTYYFECLHERGCITPRLCGKVTVYTPSGFRAVVIKSPIPKAVSRMEAREAKGVEDAEKLRRAVSAS
jgi:hypothetical protein